MWWSHVERSLKNQGQIRVERTTGGKNRTMCRLCFWKSLTGQLYCIYRLIYFSQASLFCHLLGDSSGNKILFSWENEILFLVRITFSSFIEIMVTLWPPWRCNMNQASRFFCVWFRCMDTEAWDPPSNMFFSAISQSPKLSSFQNT